LRPTLIFLNRVSPIRIMAFYVIIRGPLGVGKSSVSEELANQLMESTAPLIEC